MMRKIVLYTIATVVLFTGMREIVGQPVIISQPTAPVVVSEGTDVTLAVEVEIQDGVTYQWYKNDVAIAGAVGSSLLFSSIKMTDFGIYYVLAADAVGEIKSHPVVIRVSPAPDLTITEQPQSLSVEEGIVTSLSVVVDGGDAYRYVWYHNGVPVPDSNSTELVFSPVKMSHAGDYKVEISTPSGTVTSNTAVLSVLPGAIRIVNMAASQSFKSGVRAGLWVVIESDDGVIPEYKWFKNGEPISIPSNIPSYDIYDFSAADEGEYYVQISTLDTIIESDPITFSLDRQSIDIIRNPASYEVLMGGTAEFNVQAESEKKLSYQWYKDGVAIPGANDNLLVISPVSELDAGQYRVTVSNSLDQVDSLPGLLVPITGPLKVQSPPQSHIALLGQSHTFSVSIIGSLEIDYQWLKNGEPIPGATSAVLTLSDLTTDDSGEYALAANNDESAVTTEPAVLVVSAPELTILEQPSDKAVSEGEPVTLQVVVTSPSSIRYKWFQDGNEIPNSNSSTLRLSGPSEEIVGQYYVVMTSSGLVVTSSTAQVRMADGPEPDVRLEVRKSGDSLELSWPVRNTVYSIESIGSIGANWSRLDLQPTEIGGLYVVKLPFSERTEFFRLMAN